MWFSALRRKKKEVKKVNVPVTGKHALLFLVVFVPFIHSVCTIYAFWVYIGWKDSVI